MMLKVIIALAFLIYSSILDLKDRRVPNRVWIWMFVTLLPFTVYEVTFRVDEILFAVIGASLVIVLPECMRTCSFRTWLEGKG
jgi:prepilin signal peptidase PulO-like enzyme (type II secretory pathway)